MPGSLRVTWDDVAGTAQQLSAGAESIMGQLHTMRGRVGALSGTWNGAAQASFDQLFASWAVSSDQLHQALTGIAQLLSQTAEAYRQTEAAIAGSFTR
ncbi:MAG: WXG100 family type VII secretion target [Acidimicrobiia bacterium]